MTSCSRCGAWWQTCQSTKSKARARHREPSKPRERVAMNRGALSPFSAGRKNGKKDSEPWVATTPQSRINAILPAKEEIEKSTPAPSASASTGTQVTNEQAREQLQALLSQSGETLSAEMKQALLGLTKPPEEVEGLKHSHLYRLENAKKGVVKLRERLASVDSEWAKFMKALSSKYTQQRDGYLVSRKEIVEALNAKIAQYNQAQEEIKSKAKAGTGDSLKEDDSNPNGETPPWTADIELIDLEGDQSALDFSSDIRQPYKHRRVSPQPGDMKMEEK